MDGPSGGSSLRRFRGPAADELAIVCRPVGQATDASGQTEEIYRKLARTLSENRASFDDLTRETLFLRDARRDLPSVLAVRTRILAEQGQRGGLPLPSFIEQAPTRGRACFELSATATAPHRRAVWEARDVGAVPACSCEGCAQSGARLVRLQGTTSASTTNVYGAGGDAYEQAWAMFCEAERLLARCGMEFRDVVRTWVHLRDIDRDYQALNRARRDFFRDRGIERRPASTGVQGGPWPEAHDLSLSLRALKSSRPLDIQPMSSPSLNEAWSYGADFSRGLRVADANKVTLHVSGTASIDEAGGTAHPGDLEAQVDRMLHNIASLLAGQGAGFEDLTSGVVYLKDVRDAPRVRSLLRERGFDAFPYAMVEAGLCRPELLCEAEAVALLAL